MKQNRQKPVNIYCLVINIRCLKSNLTRHKILIIIIIRNTFCVRAPFGASGSFCQTNHILNLAGAKSWDLKLSCLSNQSTKEGTKIKETKIKKKKSKDLKPKPVEGHRILPVKSDVVFKIFFADKRNIEFLTDFLKSTLSIPDEEYDEVVIADPHLKREYLTDKLGISLVILLK